MKLKQIKHFTYYLLALVISRCVLILPRKITLNVGVLLGDLFFLLFRRERNKAFNNLFYAFGTEKSADQIYKICRGCFRNLGKGLLEFLQFPKLKPDNFRNFINIEGKQNIDEVLRRGKGGIVLTAHFGNWELVGASFPLLGYRSNTIVRPAKLQKLDEFVNRYRKKTGLNCIGRGTSVKSAIQCLKRNELLGILADVDTKVDGVFVDFFGHPAYTPRGPVSIALKTNAGLLPTFIVRQKDDSHKLIIEQELKLVITGNTEEDIKVNTQAFTKIIESYIRKYPDQWIWFHDRWKTKI
ncbi:MAG: lysophospholipid acyltransferase family protein [bacterium]